jgi:hypothetical protein
MCGGGGDGGDAGNDPTGNTDGSTGNVGNDSNTGGGNDPTGNTDGSTGNVGTGGNTGSNSDESIVGDDPSGAGDDGVGPNDGPGDGSTNSPSGNTFGIGGTSKTGSTAMDAAIGYTNGIGTGEIGNNFSSLDNASESDVNEAIDMANRGFSVSQIGDMLSGSAGSDSVAGSTAGSIANTGRTVVGYNVTGSPVYSSGRTASVPDSLTSTISSTSGNTVGAGSGFSAVTDALTDEDFGMMSSRGDVTGVSGYDNSSKMDDRDMSWGPNGFGPPDLDAFGSIGPSVQSLTDIDNTGFSTGPQSAGLGGSLFGGSVVETDKKDLDIATIAPGYGRDFGMNLGSFMNTPNMAGVTPTQAMSTAKSFGFSNYAPYSNISTKAGGQSPTYGVSLADYSFNKDGTVTGRFSGQNEGFFGSDIGGVFSAISGMPALSALNTAGSLANASRKGAFSTISNMVGLVSPTAAAITAPINAYATFKGLDLDSMMGLGANQGYMSQTSPSSSFSGGDDNSINAPVSSAPKIESSTNDMRQIDRPDTMPTDLLRRRKRRAGQDVYGVSGSSPFLNYSDDIDTSGMGSYAGKSRSGQFKSAPTGR